MPRGGIEHPERESKVERTIRLAYEEIRQRLLQELVPVEGYYRKLNDTLIHVRNLIELLIGMKVGDHPVCGVNAPRDFFKQAGEARSGAIKELVGGQRLAALLAQYDEVAAVAVPLRAAIADVDRLMGKEPSQSAAWARRGADGVDGHGRKTLEQSIVSWIAVHGSIRVTNGCAIKLGCDRATFDRAVTSLLAAGKIREMGGSEASGFRYDFAVKSGGRGANGAGAAGAEADGVGEGEVVMLGTFRYDGPRPVIARAICEKLQTGAAFVNSRAFCEEVDCHPPASLQVVVALIKAGILTKEGNGRASIYPLTPRGKSLIRARATRA